MDTEKEIKELTKTIVEFKEKNDIPLGVDWHANDLARFIVETCYRETEERHKEELRKLIHEIEEGIANTTIVTDGTEYDFRQGYDTLEVDEVISDISKKYGV